MKIIAKRNSKQLADNIRRSINNINWWNKKIPEEMRKNGIIMTHDDNFDTFYKVFATGGNELTIEAVTPSDCRQWVSIAGDTIEVGHDGPRASGPAELLLAVLPDEWENESPKNWEIVEYSTGRRDFVPYIALLGYFGDGPKTFWDWYINFGGREELLQKEEKTRKILRVIGYRLSPDVVSQVKVLDDLKSPVVTGAFKIGSGLLRKKGQSYEPWEVPLEAVTGVAYKRLCACGIKL